MIAAQCGVKVLEGLKSTTRIPRQAAATVAYWTGEQTAPTASNQTIDYVQLQSRMVGCQTQVSRLFIMESLLAAEGFVRDDLSAVIARAIDKAVFVGDGAGVSPTGVLYSANVNTITFAAGDPTWAEVVALETAVAKSNALFGSLAYVTSPQGVGKLKNTPKIGSTFPVYLLGENNQINTYPVYSSTEIPSDLTESSSSTLTPLMFGNWEQALMGIFGEGMSILVDPYSAGAQGDLRIYALLNADVALRHPQAFAYGADMKTV